MSDAPVLVAVPNISEGTDTELVRRIAGTRCLLDVHADPDHNRSVLTYAGELGPLSDALYGMVDRAASFLDIREHEGVHPRFGVVDVLPIVPYRASLSAAQALAIDLSWRIAQGPGVPVHTYGAAASDGRTLPELRRMLRESDVLSHPTAGLICLGIRDPLIAFNVNLDATLDEAEAIARAVRSSAIRALGFDLPSRGLVQVSMNLVDPLNVGPAAAFEAVAARSGAVVDAEVVGLVPDEVLDQLSSLPLRVPARGIAAAFAQVAGG